MTTPSLELRVLGDFSLRTGGQELAAQAPARLRSLLTYLVLHRHSPQPRGHVAFRFWPDATEAQARNSLRQLLFQLRVVLPGVEPLLVTTPQTLQWHPSQECWVDVVAFEEALTQSEAAARRSDEVGRKAALEEAEQVYRGDLLPGGYEEWLLPERERLRERYLQVLEALLDLAEKQSSSGSGYGIAIGYAQRLLVLERLREDRYRRLMGLYVRGQDRASALRVYHTCVTTLREELGVAPDPATQAVYERLLQGVPSAAAEAPPASADAVTAEEPLVGTGMAELIGRQPEWTALGRAWETARQGQPAFVLVSGEAGIGKSRLAGEFVRWAGQQGAVTAQTRSYAAEGQLSLAPVTEWLRSQGLRRQLGQLERVWLRELARLLPELGAEHPDLPPYEPVTEYGQRQRFFEALARAVLIGGRPLVLLIDDLQWCDQETLEWLHFLLRYDAGARLLVVGCARAEEVSPQHPLHKLLLHMRSSLGVTELALQPLDAAETGKLAAQVAKQELELGAVMRLYHDSGGYPLFVVEMVQAGLGLAAGLPRPLPEALRHPSSPEVGSDELPTLPPRVHAVLVGRLRQVSPAAKEWLDLAATIGREFTLELLMDCGGGDADSAVRALDELWQRRIVREYGASSYDFTHDRLREVAYAEISAPHRRRLHFRLAQALAAHSSDLDEVSGQIAWHYERAGETEQALPFYQRAAAVAQRRYANQDAISLLSHSLHLLELLPAGAKRDKQDLGLQLILAPLYRVTKGWATPELEQVLNRALALCDLVGDDVERVQVLYGLQSVYVVQAKLDRVHMLSDEIQVLYQRSFGGRPPLLAGMMMAGSWLHLGRFAEADAQLAEIIATDDPDQIRQIVESQGWNCAIHSRAWRAHALWCLGYPDQALQLGLEAVRQVQHLNQPFNQALASAYLALLQQLSAERPVAREQAKRALALATTYQATYYSAWSSILLGYAEALERPTEEAIRRLRASISHFTASNARLRLPYYLSLLAEVYQKAGRLEEAIATVDEGMAAARATNERWWDAELHRLRGELLLALGGAETGDGAALLLRAIVIARSQEAKSLELRATTSLARLWISQGQVDDARERLREVYGFFTEGLESPDLQAARRLLAEL